MIGEHGQIAFRTVRSLLKMQHGLTLEKSDVRVALFAPRPCEER